MEVLPLEHKIYTTDFMSEPKITEVGYRPFARKVVGQEIKIPQLRGIQDTGPYFHDNSAKTLEDVMAHYTKFFAIVTGGGLILTPQDEADVVAFMKLLR